MRADHVTVVAATITGFSLRGTMKPLTGTVRAVRKSSAQNDAKRRIGAISLRGRAVK